jgi:ribosomal protein L37E
MSAGSRSPGSSRRQTFHARCDRCGHYGALKTGDAQTREEQLCLPCAYDGGSKP